MDVPNGPRQLGHQSRAGPRSRSALLDISLQVHAANVIHDDKRPAFVKVQIDHAHQVGMIAGSKQPSFAQQPLAAVAIDPVGLRAQLEDELLA